MMGCAAAARPPVGSPTSTRGAAAAASVEAAAMLLSEEDGCVPDSSAATCARASPQPSDNLPDPGADGCKTGPMDYWPGWCMRRG